MKILSRRPRSDRRGASPTLVGVGALTTIPDLFTLFGRGSDPHPDLLIVRS